MKWAKIVDFDYEVSENGDVRNTHQRQGTRGGYIKPELTIHGYHQVALWKNNKRTRFKVHRLVAKYFIDGFIDDCEIDHINGNRIDNRLENLRIVSCRENCHNNLYKSEKSSSYYGVSQIGIYKDGTPRWRARIWIDNKSTHLGYFKSELEAHQAYQKKLDELNGKV